MKQYERYKKGKNVIKKISENRDTHYIVHYACQDITDDSECNFKVFAIALKRLGNAQTHYFSITKELEKQGDSRRNYQKAEKEMLKQFFEFIKNDAYCFIHWNMRDDVFGFQSLEHRYQVLGGSPFILKDEKKIDLARIFIKMYTPSYCKNPRLEHLLDINHISKKDFLNGEQEALALKNENYNGVKLSLLRKVECICNLIDKEVDNKLKVESRWYNIYGVSIQGFFEILKTTWWGNFILFVLGIGVTLLMDLKISC